MDLIKEYKKPQNYVPSLRTGLVKGFQEYMNTNNIPFKNYDESIVEYIDTLDVTNKTKATYRNMLRTLINNIIINNNEKKRDKS